MRQPIVASDNNQLFTAAEYRDITIAWRNGAPVWLGNVAEFASSTRGSAAGNRFGWPIPERRAASGRAARRADLVG
jgi:hypothetical protein